MRRRERYVDVARFLDRLAAVHRFQDGELACPLLELARDAVQVLGAFGAGEAAPTVLVGVPGGVDGDRYILGAGFGDLGEDLFGGGVDRREGTAGLRLDELPVDEQAVTVLEPHDVGGLGGGRVLPGGGSALGCVLDPVGHAQSIVK